MFNPVLSFKLFLEHMLSESYYFMFGPFLSLIK